MPERATNKSAEALVVGMAPDVCLTPMGSGMVPVAYTITSKFDVAEKTAPKVNYCGLPAFTMASRLPRVEGDEAGTGGGIISHVNRGYCRPVEHSGTVRAHGQHVVRHGDLMHMNCNGPDGPANTYGRIVYIGAGAAGEVGRETLHKESTVTVDNKTGKTTVEEREITRDPKTGAVTEARQRTEIDPKTGEIKTQRESITTGPEGERSYEASTGHFDPAEQRYGWTTQNADLPSQSPTVEIADNHPEVMADADYQAAMKEQAAVQAEIDATNKELAWEAAKTAADVAGLIDPTPISDTIGAGMALSDGDFLGAGLSMVSWIPYLGDAVAKPIKGTRTAAKIAKLMDKLVWLKGKLKKLQELAEAAKKRVKDFLKKGKKGYLPNPSKKPKNAGDGGKILKPKVVVKEGKWDYFFGRVKSNDHNLKRSLQNKKDLEDLGFVEQHGGREKLTKVFEDGLQAPETARHTSEFGTTITRTVNVGDKGAIDVKYFYPGGNLTATPEISTIIPKIFK